MAALEEGGGAVLRLATIFSRPCKSRFSDHSLMSYRPDSPALCQAKLWQDVHCTAAGMVGKLLERLTECERDLLVGWRSHQCSSSRCCYRNGCEECGLKQENPWTHWELDAIRSSTRDFEQTLTHLNAPPGLHSRLKAVSTIERLIKELDRKSEGIRIFRSDIG